MYIKEEEEEETEIVELEPDVDDIPKIEKKSDVHIPSSYDVVEKVKNIFTGKDGHKVSK